MPVVWKGRSANVKEEWRVDRERNAVRVTNDIMKRVEELAVSNFRTVELVR